MEPISQFKEQRVDLWEGYFADLVITTNGFVKNNGEAVMGAGCAKEAATRFSWLPQRLGSLISLYGNHVFLLDSISDDAGETVNLWSFPVKHHWREKADIELIKRSANELKEINRNYGIALPRPGCGNGKLDWETEVKPALQGILDGRFTIIYK